MSRVAPRYFTLRCRRDRRRRLSHLSTHRREVARMQRLWKTSFRRDIFVSNWFYRRWRRETRTRETKVERRERGARIFEEARLWREKKRELTQKLQFRSTKTFREGVNPLSKLSTRLGYSSRIFIPPSCASLIFRAIDIYLKTISSKYI